MSTSQVLAFASGLLLLVLLIHSASAQIKFNELQMKNSHNSYERLEGLLDQMIYHHVRSIEIDINLSSNKKEFRVYHDAGYLQSYSSLSTLFSGVRTLLEFNSLFPDHHVVSVFVDLKGGFGPQNTPDDFDNTIGLLPLFTPQDLRPSNESSIQAGIEANGWPDIEDMRGKFIWVITSGQDTYCTDDETCNARKAFFGTSVKVETDVGAKSYAVFYNQNSKNSEFAKLIHDKGYVSRVYDLSDIDSPEKWDKAVADKFNIIATDKVNYHQHTFSKTHNALGFPFQLMDGSDASEFDGEEGGRVMYMYANNDGDAWGRVDDIHYAYETVDPPIGQWMEYSTTISVSNSHCAKFAKAGIMMRSETRNEDFPLGSGQYYAVVRTCDELVRVQYREVPFLYTVAQRLPEAASRSDRDGIEQAKRASLKIRYLYDGQNTTAEGYWKIEGIDKYILIDSTTFPDLKFTFHGLFTSSHYWDGNADGTDFKALFVNTRENNVPVTSANLTRLYPKDGFAFGDGYFSPSDASLSAGRRLDHHNLRGD